MIIERWTRIRELFAKTHELSPAERANVLNESCAADPHLRSEVEALLASHDTADELFPPLDKDLMTTAAMMEDRVGKRVGPYRIVRQVAFGGMGEVYEAVRDDGLFDKRVAIKLVRYGMPQTELLKRFNHERQTLAKLDHPNIARLIDGGSMEDGIPFLVMEFVEGKRIDIYCDENRLTVQQRLRLFLTVCSAVQFAHQNLIVHRDIKPGNILVTENGAPKLLDFGIAKLLADTDGTREMTRTGGSLFTPEYASPEQIIGKNITTISDVYSLGVLLYKLLTGQKPYELENLLPFEISQTIVDREPTKPSIKKITIVAGDGTQEKIRRELMGDLDTIVLMALRKEPHLRYQSVQELSEDIRRYLDHSPVSARKGEASYRLSKFVRRNRAGVIGAALVVASLLAGLAATMYQVHVTRLEKARAESISAFLKRTLSYSNPVRTVPGKSVSEATVKDMLDEAARRVESDELAGQLDVKADVERTIAESYGWQGRYDLMDQHLRNYAAIQEQLYGENDPKTLDAFASLAAIAFRNGDMVKAEESFRRILPSMRNAFKDRVINAEVLFNALLNFGYLRRTQGDSREAEQSFTEALALGLQLPEELRYALGVTRSTLASTLADQGRFSDALQTAERAVNESRQQGTVDMPGFGFSLTVFGGFLTEQGNFAEADSALHEAEAIFRRLQAPSILWLGDNLRNQAASLYLQGKYIEAQAKISEALKIYRESFGTHYDHYPTALTIQGLSLSRTGNTAEAEKLLREAVRLREELLPKEHFFTALAQGGLGEFLTLQKRFAEAEPLLLQSYAILERSQGPTNPRAILAKHRLAMLYREWNKPAFAAKYVE